MPSAEVPFGRIQLLDEMDNTHTADNRLAPPAFSDQISGAAAGFPIVARPPRVFHVVPIPRPGPIPQCLFPVDGELLVETMEGREQEDPAILEQGVADLATGPRQVVEGV